MIWCRLINIKILNTPIDNGKTLKDGNRLFGNNKTWKGFIGYIILGTVCTVIWGIICNSSLYLYTRNYFYDNHSNTVFYNVLIGFLLGTAYAVFELPNSFLKRRLGIIEGKTTTGALKWFFVFIDQADSIFGCALVLCLICKLDILLYVECILLGAATHIILNILLYLAHLRKNPF